MIIILAPSDAAAAAAAAVIINDGCPGLVALVNWLLVSLLGSGCSTVVEHMPCDREVMGLNTAGCWALFLLYLICSASFSKSHMEVQHYYSLLKNAKPCNLRQTK